MNNRKVLQDVNNSINKIEEETEGIEELSESLETYGFALSINKEERATLKRTLQKISENL